MAKKNDYKNWFWVGLKTFAVLILAGIVGGLLRLILVGPVMLLEMPILTGIAVILALAIELIVLGWCMLKFKSFIFGK